MEPTTAEHLCRLTRLRRRIDRCASYAMMLSPISSSCRVRTSVSASPTLPACSKEPWGAAAVAVLTAVILMVMVTVTVTLMVATLRTSGMMAAAVGGAEGVAPALHCGEGSPCTSFTRNAKDTGGGAARHTLRTSVGHE